MEAKQLAKPEADRLRFCEAFALANVNVNVNVNVVVGSVERARRARSDPSP